MLTADTIFDRFETLLDEERVALRVLDGQRVGLAVVVVEPV